MKNGQTQTDPRIKEFGEAKYRQYREWFNQRLDDAIKAAEVNQNQAVDSSRSESNRFFLILFSYHRMLLKDSCYRCLPITY